MLLPLLMATNLSETRWSFVPVSALELSGLALAEKSENSSATRCRIDLESLHVSEQLDDLSIYRFFNDQVRVAAGLLGPRERALSELKSLALTRQCLTHIPFGFNVFENGELREGNSSDLHPVYAWKRGGGYVVTYAFKKYSEEDGDGDVLVFSILTFSASGVITGAMEEVSSWYEYEGYVRIRDARFSDETIEVTEQIFTPTVRDKFGRIIAYDNGSTLKVIGRYLLENGEYREGER